MVSTSEIGSRRDRRRRFGVARAFVTGGEFRSVSGDLDRVNLTQVTVAGQLAGEAEVSVGALPGAGLEDALDEGRIVGTASAPAAQAAVDKN